MGKEMSNLAGIDDTVKVFAEGLRRMSLGNVRGLPYRFQTSEWLFMRLRQEVGELDYEIHHTRERSLQDVQKECLDVAAFAMMLSDRIQIEQDEECGGEG